jgi:hypothetical protein
LKSYPHAIAGKAGAYTVIYVVPIANAFQIEVLRRIMFRLYIHPQACGWITCKPAGEEDRKILVATSLCS